MRVRVIRVPGLVYVSIVCFVGGPDDFTVNEFENDSTPITLAQNFQGRYRPLHPQNLTSVLPPNALRHPQISTCAKGCCSLPVITHLQSKYTPDISSASYHHTTQPLPIQTYTQTGFSATPIRRVPNVVARGVFFDPDVRPRVIDCRGQCRGTERRNEARFLEHDATRRKVVP